jgi:hypothetical protein
VSRDGAVGHWMVCRMLLYECVLHKFAIALLRLQVLGTGSSTAN